MGELRDFGCRASVELPFAFLKVGKKYEGGLIFFS
jgi:hypothetical protein